MRLGYSDFLKYHQGKSICGLSLGFKMIQKLTDYFNYSLPKSDTKIYAKFGGPGMRDAFCYIFRGKINESSFIIKKDLKMSLECSDSPVGIYGYEVHAHNRIIQISIKPKVVKNDFLEAIRLRNKSGISSANVYRLQMEMCKRILPINPNIVCNIKELS